MSGLPLAYLAALTDLATPTQVSLVSVQAEPDRIRLTWFGAERIAPTPKTYRRTLESDWQGLGAASVDGTGRIVYEDTQVSPGVRYGYRLGVVRGGREEFMGETWVEVPRAPEFALAGLRPNPSAQGLTVDFALPDEASARLELMDLAGRSIVARDVGALGPGRHLLNLGRGKEIAPGVYLLRLTRGDRSLTARAVVVR